MGSPLSSAGRRAQSIFRIVVRERGTPPKNSSSSLTQIDRIHAGAVCLQKLVIPRFHCGRVSGKFVCAPDQGQRAACFRACFRPLRILDGVGTWPLDIGGVSVKCKTPNDDTTDLTSPSPKGNKRVATLGALKEFLAELPPGTRHYRSRHG